MRCFWLPCVLFPTFCKVGHSLPQRSDPAPSVSQVWLHAPYELHLSLFEHFIELLTESRHVSKVSFAFIAMPCIRKSEQFLK